MSKFQKSLDRFRTIPKDFTWDELVALLRKFGFEEDNSAGGSHRTFEDGKGQKLFLAKPHPGNIVRCYALRQLKDWLIEHGLIQNED